MRERETLGCVDSLAAFSVLGLIGSRLQLSNRLKCPIVAVDRDEFWSKVTDTDSPEKISDLSDQQLRDYERYFVQVRYDPTLPDPHERDTAATHTTLLQREIDRRFGGKTLCWARIAGVFAILSVLIAVVALGVQIWFAKAAPSKPGVASPTPSLQTPAPMSESSAQVPGANPAMPSPQSQVTATP